LEIGGVEEFMAIFLDKITFAELGIFFGALHSETAHKFIQS